MLVGQEQPVAGSIEIGDTVQLSYVDQSRDALRADRTVFQEITDGVEVVKVGPREIPARAYVSSFNFRGTDQQKLERLARESKSADARQRTLARELAWVRMGARARQAKGKARLSAYEKLLAEANDAKATTRELEIAIPPGPRLGDTVIEVRDPVSYTHLTLPTTPYV